MDMQLQHTVAARLEETKSRSSRLSSDQLIGLSHFVAHDRRMLRLRRQSPLLSKPSAPAALLHPAELLCFEWLPCGRQPFPEQHPRFLTLRAVRIFPALFCEVTISALILGPMLTTFSLQKYFSDLKFYTYFLNVIGRIHYYLPGLFLDNPFPQNVNNQLWTIPFELECYIAITILALLWAWRSDPDGWRLFLSQHRSMRGRPD
jgi:hypothetical protein